MRVRPNASPLHRRDTDAFQQVGDEVRPFPIFLPVRCGLADTARARRIDIERALWRRAMSAFSLVQHFHHQIAAFLEHLVALGNIVVRAGQPSDRGAHA